MESVAKTMYASAIKTGVLRIPFLEIAPNDIALTSWPTLVHLLCLGIITIIWSAEEEESATDRRVSATASTGGAEKAAHEARALGQWKACLACTAMAMDLASSFMNLPMEIVRLFTTMDQALGNQGFPKRHI